MPTRHAIKTYIDGGYYHLYNRGVNKMRIYRDNRDYRVFLSYLRTYLLPKDFEKLNQLIASPDTKSTARAQAIKELNLHNFHKKISLIAYCLMPNHYHLLVQIDHGKDLENFMRAMMTRYTKYINSRHRRVGPVFQGRYQAVLVETDEQLLYLTRYIHRNPIESKKTVFSTKRQSLTKILLEKQPSSYPVYLQRSKQAWVNPDSILGNFSKTGFNSYQSFVEDRNDTLEQEAFSQTHTLMIDLEN